MLDADTCHAACDAKDRRFDGRFYIGVTSTGIYCRCICPARTPKKQNRTFWPSAAAAEAAGFRPCLLCRPERAPGLAPIDAPARLAAAAYARIEAGALEEQGLEALAEELGVTSRHLRRVMNAQFGASPIDIAQTGRLLAARRLLNETALPITEIAFASGFRSLRRFNATMKDRYGAPPSKMRGRKSIERGETFTVSLSPRGDYNIAPILQFLSLRALPGVEIGGAKTYARALKWGDALGWLEIGMGPKGLALTLSENLAPHLRPLVANVRGAFDLDAEMTAVDAHLAADPEFAGDVKREPGVRVPGALDGFETAIRAVLGQQVTVIGARTLTERLVERFGARTPGFQPANGGELTHAFPDASALANAGADAIAKIGLPKKRAETLHHLAVASSEGRLPLARGAIAAGRAALSTIPGIGPWTVEYIALRALGDPDAYPASDIALINALGRKGETLEHLKPWRAYAAIRLWRRAAKKGLRP
ncbi:MAG TPA: AlkA N-terminal domain-containing protein [Vitreimonas sp.]|uniref:AlkA N-terminal domain-containing protein n=1 Tax=Vitreimonas sp. TaxID=3069702 RepID=UPI002D70676E|nr:AlkA N-terminal domain-containing protein [Vitreimonas sp.]HYD86101.1 AlkA N-terminal domain-containing protein [Vitreimonas sp.]